MLHADHLRTERLADARGLLCPTPEFTWTLQANQPGGQPSASEVEVDLVPPVGAPTPLWRPGRQAWSLGQELRYAGALLPSRALCRWRVRVWDAAGVAEGWSAWTHFEMGVLAPDQLSGAWIAGGSALRRELTVGPGLVRARAYVSGLGYYEFSCNGARVSAAALAPSFTEFPRRVEYETIDLTPHLRAGANAVGFLLADGWWRHGAGAPQQRTLQAIGELVLDYADGRREVLGTDTTWQAAAGPWLTDVPASPHQLFDGVALNGAWLAGDWCRAGGGSAGWQTATLASTTEVGTLVPALLPPVREVETLKPREVRRLSPTLVVVDLGQNCTGWLRIHAQGPAGTRVVLRHAELRDADGRLNPGTLRSAKQVDTLSLAGTPGSEVVEPRLLYHGFRYAEIESSGAELDLESVRGVVVHTDLPVVGEVTTSDARLNWLFSALRWTVRSNAFSVMTDVCQRDERRGWLMDGVTGLKAGLLFYDFNAFGRKWFDDMVDNQQPDGSLRGDCAPVWGPCRSVGWQRALVLLPLTLYETYGDRSLLAHAWPYMRRYADFLLVNLKDDLLPGGFSRHPAEWLCIGRRHDELADNALAIDVLRQVAAAARILAVYDAPDYYAAADRIAAAAHRRWYDAPSACYGGGEGFAQSSQVYALRFGITPPVERQRVFERLLDDLLNARGDGPFVTTGIGSTEHLPLVLSSFGRDDLVWAWLQRDAYPGYGFMQRRGATAIWERWEEMNYYQMNAHNHTGLTGIGVWLRQFLVGLRTVPGATPVFHLRPAVHLPLAALSARWQSQWGTVGVAWQTGATGRVLTVEVPAGCIAQLTLPGAASTQRLAPGQHTFTVG